MAKLLYKLAVATSKYQDRDGKERTNWENIGAVYETERDGKVSRFITLKATFNPAGIERKQGTDNIIVSLFPPKDKEQSYEQRSSAVSQAQSSYGDSEFGNVEQFPF